MKFSDFFFQNINYSIEKLDKKKLEKIVDILLKLRSNNGRLFIIGVGGSAGNASHAVCDLRKLTG